jgi:BirA family biotin operon repressor/biotin-[acetyl-CoA-carboxylase] ligase
VVALAVRDSIADVAPQLAATLKLKWPNDLLFDGAKLAGILIEAESAGGLTAVAAGIGVNCAHHPDNLAYPATSLAAAGAAIAPDALLQALSHTMASRLTQWGRGSGFAAIRAEWLKHAANIGGGIHVRLPDREVTGTFETLDRMGRLMLRLPAGNLEAITVGELFAPARVQP